MSARNFGGLSVTTVVAEDQVEQHGLHQPKWWFVNVVVCGIGSIDGRKASFAALIKVEQDQLLSSFKKLFCDILLKFIQRANRSHGKDKATTATNHGVLVVVSGGAKLICVCWGIEGKCRDVQEGQVGVEIMNVRIDIALNVDSTWEYTGLC